MGRSTFRDETHRVLAYMAKRGASELLSDPLSAIRPAAQNGWIEVEVEWDEGRWGRARKWRLTEAGKRKLESYQ